MSISSVPCGSSTRFVKASLLSRKGEYALSPFPSRRLLPRRFASWVGSVCSLSKSAMPSCQASHLGEACHRALLGGLPGFDCFTQLGLLCLGSQHNPEGLVGQNSNNLLPTGGPTSPSAPFNPLHQRSSGIRGDRQPHARRMGTRDALSLKAA